MLRVPFVGELALEPNLIQDSEIIAPVGRASHSEALV